jgi:hypothetical protein
MTTNHGQLDMAEIFNERAFYMKEFKKKNPLTLSSLLISVKNVQIERAVFLRAFAQPALVIINLAFILT